MKRILRWNGIMEAFIMLILIAGATAIEDRIEPGAPLLDITLPKYTHSQDISVTGKTSPYTSITVFVNNAKAREISDTEIGEKGIIDFSLKLSANELNKVRIEARA